MILPTIHRNGTDPRDLIEALSNAREKLRDALQAVHLTAPHPRDFPRSARAHSEALAEHGRRVHTLTRLHAELGELAEGIDDQLADATPNTPQPKAKP